MEDRYKNIQGTIPPTNSVNNADRYKNIQGTTPIEEEKKNNEVVSEVSTVGNEIQQTTPQVPTTPEPKQNTVSNLFNQYSATVDIARATNKVSDKPEGKIDKMFTTPNEFGSKYMPKAKQKEFEQTNPNAIQKSTSQPIQKQPNKWDSNTKIVETKPDDKLRLDGTEKGKGFYGEITVQSGEEQGKTMTELSVGYEVDGKEVLVPLLNPYTSLDDIENVRAGGQPSEQMYKDAERWLNYSLANNRSPFATEEEKVDVYTDEDNKIKFKSATDLNNYVVTNMDDDDKRVLTGEANPYPIGSTQYQDYANREAARDMLNEQMQQFSKDTGYDPNAYLDYQEYLINGGTSFNEWEKKWNGESPNKVKDYEALALTLAALPTLTYDVVFRNGDMIKRIAKGTGEFATGLRTGSVMGDISYITQGLFTLTKEGKYNPFRSAGELKQRDVEWVNRFDRNAKDEVALFMGSIGVDYMPFEAAGNITNKMIQTLTKVNASNYYNLMLRTGVLPESAMGITEKVVSGAMQMGGTLGLYSGAQSTLNQLMYSTTPEQFFTEGLKTILTDVQSSVLTGVVAGGVGGAMGVLTNQVKNKIINDAMKNGILDATKLQKFAYVGTGVAGGTISTMLEASTFVAMSGEELNAKNILKESIKFATLKFQNPAGLKIDKIQDKTTIDSNFTPDKAWKDKFEPKLNEAELDMLGCKDVAEVQELVKKEGLDAVIEGGIPVSTAFKLANAECGIVVPAKNIDFAPDKVTITNEVINGKEYSVVNTWNKDGELTHVSPHENYKDATTEVEFITNKMQEYRVFKAADRLKPEWYAEFNQTANVDKIALNDALQSKELTPEQSNVIKDFNKQVDDFIAKKEKETPNEKPKKKEKVVKKEEEDKKPIETPIEYEGKEYTVTEKDGQTTVQVKDAYGKDVPVRDTEIETKVKELYDTQDKAGLQGSEQKGETVVEEQPIETTGKKEITTGGDVQTLEEKTQLINAPKEKIDEIQSEKMIFTLKEVGKIKEAENIKTIRETAKSVNEFNTKIAKFLKAVRKEGTLSPARYNTLIRKIGNTIKETKRKDGTVITPEMKKDAVVDYVVKAIVKAANKKDVQQAVKSMDKITQMTKSKNMLFGTKTLDLQRALDIDVSQLEPAQVNELNGILKKLSAEGKKVTSETIDKTIEALNNIAWTPKERKVKTYEDAEQYITDVYDKEIKDAADYKAAVSKIRRANALSLRLYSEGKITAEQYDTLQEKIQGEKNAESLDKLVEKAGENVKEEYLENADVSVSEFIAERSKGNDFGLPKPSIDSLDKTVALLKNAEIRDLLSVADTERIDYVLENANNGFINGETVKAMDRIAELDKFIKTKDFIESIKETRKWKAFENLDPKVLEKRLQAITGFRIDQYFGKITHKGYDAVFSGLNEAMVNAEKYEQNLGLEVRDSFRELHKKGKGSYRNSIVKIAILRNERTWQNNDKNVDGVKPEHQKNFWDAAFSRMGKGEGKGQVKNVDNYNDTIRVWKELKKDKSNFKADGSLDVEKVYNSLSKAEKKVFDNLDSFFEKTDADTNYAAMKNGRVYNRLNNYDMYHSSNEIEMGGKSKEETETLINQMINKIDSATKQYGSTYDRDMRARIIRTDIDNIVAKQIKDLAHDLYINPTLTTTMRGVKDVSRKADETTLSFTDSLNKMLAGRVIRASGLETIKDDVKFAKLLFGTMSNIYLGNIKRIPKEMAGNLTRNVISEGVVAKRLNQSYRDMLTEIIGDDVNYSSYSQDVVKGESWGVKRIQDIIVLSDKTFVPTIFAKEFNKSFKDATGKEFDAKKYNEYEYRYENFEAIEKAKNDAIVRTQELYNTKTKLDAATHIMFGFGKLSGSLDKSGILGKGAYFLQSFSHNEFNQIALSFKRIIEGFKTHDNSLKRKGFMDIIALNASNMIYLQMGALISQLEKSYFEDWAGQGGVLPPNPKEAFEDGVENYYEQNLDKENMAYTTMSSLVNLAAGKYNLAIQPIASTLLGFINADKEISQSTKDAINDMGKGIFINPIDVTSGSYLSVDNAKRLHPILNEIVNLADIIESSLISFQLKEGELDTDAVDMMLMTNGAIRYALPNPASNIINDWVKRYKKSAKYKTKHKENLGTFGTSYINQNSSYGNSSGYVNQTSGYNNDSD